MQTDFSGKYRDSFDGSRPTILFDLNGVLLQSRVFIEEKKSKNGIPVFARPGLRHLASLYPYFRIGLYTSARVFSVQPRVQAIWNVLCKDQPVKVALCSPTQMFMYQISRALRGGRHASHAIITHQRHTTRTAKSEVQTEPATLHHSTHSRM